MANKFGYNHRLCLADVLIAMDVAVYTVWCHWHRYGCWYLYVWMTEQ